ncbi:MAG: alpha/beta fold hydrolase [Candidatus Aenigmarchaeota archaeon]|nr:alpha/beta fold hydrolase [Candidatus Aenigmarchaeota archaeon]
MEEIPIAFKSRGQQVVGMLHLPKRKNAPVVIMHHGWSGDKLGPFRLFVFAAREFANHGFAVFRLDARGSGDSEGIFENQTLKSQMEDLTEAINYLQGLNGVNAEKLGLIGHSQGGKIVIMYAAKDGRVKCVDSWAGASKLKDHYSNVELRELLDKGYLDMPHYGVKVIKKSVLRDLQPQYDSVKTIRKIKIPIQITSGTNDSIVPLSTAKLLYKNANRPKKLNVIKGADHFFYPENHRKQLISSSINWFKRWLK